MDNSIYKYYDHELKYFRELGIEFGKKYDNAKYLQLDRKDDPHTERLIEAFAFIVAHLHKKIDDDFPSIIQSLINTIFPLFNQPVPSMAIIAFKPINNVPDQGYPIPRGSQVDSLPVKLYSGTTHCHFQTVYPVKLLPVDIIDAKFVLPEHANAEKTIIIDIVSIARNDLSKVSWDDLIFFINPKSINAFELYELLVNNVFCVECLLNENEKEKNISLKKSKVSIADQITTVGLDIHEHLIPNFDSDPFDYESFSGYKLLYDYFCFKEKFLFFKINGLKNIQSDIPFYSISLLIHLNKSPKSHLKIKKDTFFLYATPIVNLFDQFAEPISLNLHKHEYSVIPYRRHPDTMEVFKILDISTSIPFDSDKKVFFYPIYKRPPGIEDSDHQTKLYYWQDERRSVIENNNVNTEVYLSFKKDDLTENDTAEETVTIRTICTNGNLPAHLTFGHIEPNDHHQKHFELQISGKSSTQIICIVPPTTSINPFSDEKLQWNLISYLSNNFFTMISDNVNILRDMLFLFDFRDLPSNKKQINGILNLSCKSVVRRIKGASFCRGTQITIEFDKNKYSDTSLILFASILERFLGYLAPINSFVQIIAKTRQKNEVLKIWPPRNEHMNL